MEIEERMNALAEARRTVIKDMAVITDMRASLMSLYCQDLNISGVCWDAKSGADDFMVELVQLLVEIENQIRPLHTHTLKELGV